MTDPVVKTWDSVSKDVVADVAEWMLADCVMANRRWNLVTASDNVVSRGMQMIFAEALVRGIPAEAVTVTSPGLLTAMHDLAVANAKSVPVAKAPVPTYTFDPALPDAPPAPRPYVPYAAPAPASVPGSIVQGAPYVTPSGPAPGMPYVAPVVPEPAPQPTVPPAPPFVQR